MSVAKACWDYERQKQVVLFGISEVICSNLGHTIEDGHKGACGEHKLRVKDYCRIGAMKPGKNRPVKRLTSHEKTLSLESQKLRQLVLVSLE